MLALPLTQTIGLTSNIANRVKKIREGVVYTERTAFVAELIQNAQRAKAKNIWVDVSDGYFSIKDDGEGCADPGNVFTLDLSGWGQDVHSPFGEGFSSVFVVANRIAVQSKNWAAYFNLATALETGNFNNIVIKAAPMRTGFEVQLAYEPALLPRQEVEEQVKKIGAMLPVKTNVFFNREKVNKTMIQYEPFTVRRRLRGIGQAIVAPNKYFDPVEIIYEGRPVCNEYYSYIKGILAVNPGAVTLKAPDRRSLVADSKSFTLRQRMNELAKEVMTIIVKDYPEHISEYKHCIKEALHPAQYAKYLSYGLDTVGLRQNHNARPGQGFCVAELGESHEDIVITEHAKPKAYDRFITYQTPHANQEIKKIKELVRKNKIFYRLESENELAKLQSKVQYHGFTVLVVDELRAEALSWLKVPHLCTDAYQIEEEYAYRNIGPRNKKEKRLLALLAPVEKHYSLPQHTITFGNIKCVVKTVVNGKTVNRKVTQPYGICYKQNLQTRIVLSRRQLRIRQLPASYHSELGTAKDLKALFVMMPTIAHELAHLLHDTVDNTTEHYKAIETIQHELAIILSEAY